MLLWGLAGCGKTHFAGTAPGKRLWLNFDPDGTASLPVSEDTLLLDYSQEPDTCVSQVNSVNPFNLDGILRSDPDISTVVVDSVTAFVSKAVAHSVGHKSAPGSTFENPGPSGYGFRNRHALGLCKSVLQVTGKHLKHVIFICHEDVPLLNGEGQVQSITVLLGGSLKEEVPIHISEVWHLTDTVAARRVQVRQTGQYKPMKSRMFDTTQSVEFDISTKASPSKVSLETLFNEWQSNNYDKIQLPK
jgi:hypothetical protein